MLIHAKIFDYFRQRERGWILSLIAAVCLLYLPFLDSRFFFDDLSFFYGTALYGNAAEYFKDAPFSFDLRWLPYASLGRTWLWVGEAPHLYHLVNVLLHVSSVILLFVLLRQLLSAVLQDLDKALVSRAAWFAALLFAVHPAAVYAVGYVVQRSVLMATLFAVVMQYAYVRGLISGRKRWLVLAVVAYALAGFSREHSVLMPAVLMAMTVILMAKIQVGWKPILLTLSAMAAIGVTLVLISKGMIGSRGPVFEPMGANSLEQIKLDANEPLHLLSILTQAGLFFKYLFLWLLPNPAWMSVDMREPFVHSVSAWQGWAAALAFVAYGALGLWLLLRRGKTALAGLALLYPWLLFSVEFTTTRVQEIFVLYRSYLWMPGMMLLVALLYIKWPGRRTIFALSFAAILLTAFAWNRLWIFADNYRLWNDAALLLSSDQVQGADRILYNRGTAVSANKQAGEAIADLERSVALSPQLAPLHYALAVEYFNATRYQEALRELDLAISIDPARADYYYAKGLTLKRLKKDDQAIIQMKKSCELKNIAACMILGMSQQKK
ncbi:MAG: tetratricopeptide repeat protein [Gallionellaceae bacterium]|jgi:tetratricopeptide (TPR) repeat protein